MNRLTQLRVPLVGFVVVGVLSVGAWTVWPGSREATQLCTVEPPCIDCTQQCIAAYYPNGGDCNELEDCCMCFERW